MDYEVFLLLSAAALFFLDFVLLSMNKAGSKRRKTAGFVATIFGFGLVAATYALLVQALITNNFQIIGVYSYSSTGASALSRVYASWAGAAGSMLFLTFLLSIVYFGLRVLAFRKPDKFRTTACLVFCFVLLAFISVTLLRNPFERFAGFPLEGKGLNPSLQSFWMAIHPPIVFAAYAFVVLAYVLTLASLKTGKTLESSKLFNSSTYMAWILLTLGIALGGVWAYQVLGWGGYWAWDPVETASLLPWLLLTAYFTLKAMPANKPSLAKEFMIMVTFASLVFLSALTRGGFTTSIHSYAASAVGPVLLGFSLVMIGYFFYLKQRRNLPLFKMDVDSSSLKSRYQSISFWSLILISGVCLMGLAIANFAYSYLTFPFVLIFTISLIGLSLNERTRYTRLLVITIAALTIGVALALIALPVINILTPITLPLLVVAFSTFLYEILQSIRQKSLQRFGQSFFRLALIVLLIGVFISAGAKTTITVNNVNPNTSFQALSLSIRLSNLTLTNSLAGVYYEEAASIIPEYSRLTAGVTVQQAERTHSGTVTASFYPNSGLVLEPLIISTRSGDIYLHMEFSDDLYSSLVNSYLGIRTVPNTVSVTVQRSPMIYLVWSGVLLMLVAMTFQFAANFKEEPRSALRQEKPRSI